MSARTPLSWLRAFLALAVAGVTGLFGLAGTMSDLGPEETTLHRAALLAAIHLVAGGAVGWLVRRRWPVALLAGWGPAAVVLTRLARDGSVEPPLALASLVALPGLCLLGAWAGARVGRRRPSRSDD